MQKSVRTLIFLSLAAVSTLAAQASKNYCNNRFGFCLHYPAELEVSAERPTNGDGVVLEAGNGIQVSVSGSYNVMNWAPEKILDFTREDFADVIGLEAAARESQVTSQGFDALLVAGSYYQYAQMQAQGDVYLILTVTGPEEFLNEMKSLKGKLKVAFGHAAAGR
ncbi:MAG: hypothetical protein KDD10_00070 [Phaeodactylibacter sp.]|nr:hypothetical protein [Phaeodactylibacter sp.]MCB9297462.1 hypothetical protein [Lewinellaceae bacterium]